LERCNRELSILSLRIIHIKLLSRPMGDSPENPNVLLREKKLRIVIPRERRAE
jgi:hypothetical protein